MTIVFKATMVTVVGLCLIGCQTQSSPPQPHRSTIVKAEEKKPEPSQVPVPRKWTPAQVRLLQGFAIRESPSAWQTVQAMHAEIITSEAKLNELKAELLEFDRHPDADEDYKSLQSGLDELRHAYDAIFDRLEDAYIAAKKYEASPSRKDYQATMKRALEDGIQDANMATERYKAMIRKK